MKDWAEFIRNRDAEIRSGQTAAAARQLSQLNFKRVPRAQRLPLAQLCRRTGLVTPGLRLLTPVVRPNQAAHGTASAHELAEYALLLQRSGPVNEALAILRRIDPHAVPQAALYTAYCLFNDWEYEASIAPLETYLRLQTDPYQRLIGEVNLAAALIACDRLTDAKARLQAAEDSARSIGALRLLRNCHELRAQLSVLEGNWSEAEALLATALANVQTPVTLDQLYARKWHAALLSLRRSDPAPLTEFRALAVQVGDPETIRDTDLLLLKVRFDAEKFRHLYFGTPFPPFRRRLEQLFGTLPPVKEFVMHPEGRYNLNLVHGVSGGANAPIPRGVLTLLRALGSDFYRPRVNGSLFAELCKGEYYDINSSPGRIHQAIRRARRWLRDENIPAEIVSTGGEYRLEARSDLRLTLPAVPIAAGPEESWLENLAKNFNEGDKFSAAEAREVLGLSVFQFKQFALWAHETGKIRRYGAGPATVYFLPKQAA